MAKKSVTIEDLIYPIGHGSALSMKIIEKELTERFYKHINQYIKLQSAYKDGVTYYIHLQIPSENNGRSVSEVFYDVVLEFYPKNKSQIASIYYNEYGVKVFSNSPSFLFTFTHVYSERDALPDFIPAKFYAKEALKNPPKVRNPIELMGIDKTVWFSIRYLTHNHLFQKVRLEQICERKGSYKNILKFIKSQEDKLAERKSQKPKPKPKKERKSSSGENPPAEEMHTPVSLTQSAKPNPMKTTSMHNSMKSSSSHSMKTTSLKSSALKKSMKK